MSDFSRAGNSAWSDNMPLDTLSDALNLNRNTIGSAITKIEERFWSTPSRHGDSETREVMEITLGSVRLVNHVTFDVVRFPHDIEIEVYDEEKRRWREIYDADYDGNERCHRSILDCNPQVLPPSSSIQGEHHPQHSFSDHWQSIEFICKPVRFQRMRVILTRHRRSRNPCNATGIEVAYSLAIKSLYCGYKVYHRDCIPKPQPILTSYTEHTEFASTNDVLGSQVDYSIRVNKADNVLRNDPGLVWKSEPQPYPWCVVNYYADVRDLDGSPQTLDRFFLDPLYDGANVNLYFSNDEPDADFVAPDDPLPGNVAVINGSVGGIRPLSRPDIPYGQINYVDVDNSRMCFTPGARWWFGASLRWRFLRETDHNDHPIFDCGLFHLAWTPFGLRFATTHGDFFYTDCDRFDAATDFRFVSWYDDGHIKIQIRVNGQDHHGEHTLSVKLDRRTVAKLRFGGFFEDVVNHSPDFWLHSCVLKQDQIPDDDTVNDYLDNPVPYAELPEFAHDNDGKSNNAILAYYPEPENPDYPAGFRGGQPTKYDKMEWSPIARDYILRKGFMYFPPTKAKYWKFEFCGLPAEPYEVYVPVTKTARVYREEMWLVPVYPHSLYDKLPRHWPGCVPQISLSASFSFRSSTSVSINVNVGRGYTNTSVRIVKSTTARVTLNLNSWTWGFLPCHKPVYVPRFTKKLVHEYDYVTIEHTTKTAFFVGLKGIQAYKVDYLSLDDAAQYEETFVDPSNIDIESGWVITEDHRLDSGDSHYAQADSKVFPSNRTVRAVQFAATQTAPLQLLPDDDFDDPDHTVWDSFGDGALAPFIRQDAVIGSLLRVDRSSREPSWDTLSTSGQFVIWNDFENSLATWAQVEASGNPAQTTGGITSQAVDIPSGGRIYAAARVVAPAALSSPLYVQIIDDLTDQVLSETPQEVAANSVTEWYTSYTIGEQSTEDLVWHWADFSTTQRYPIYTDIFARANTPELGALTSKQLWRNDGQPHSVVANEAVSTAAGQHDYVDSVTPWGTLKILVGAMGTGGTDPLFDLLPIYLNDAGVLTYAGGRGDLPTTSVINRAVLASDEITIDVLPMAQVPANRRPADWVDDVSAPYALVVTLNGVWVKTIGHRLGARTRKGLWGKNGQHFRNFNWNPQSYGKLPGPSMWALPVAGRGSFDESRTTWTDVDNNQWSASGSVDNSTVPGALVITSTDAQMVVDTRYWYGTLTAGVHNVAAGTGGKHGNVLVLDADALVYLNYAGNLMQGGISYGNLIPGGLVNGSVVQIQFLDTKSVAASVRGTIDPALYPRMLVARVNGAVVGKLGNAFIQTWQGTRRGLTGDVYNGTPGALNINTGFETDTSAWSGIGGTIARSTTIFRTGVASLQLTPSGSATIARAENERVPVMPGASYTASSWVYGAIAYSLASGGVVTRINWFDASGTFISNATTAPVALAATTWTNLTLTAVAPANAVSASINPITFQGTAPATNIAYIDDSSLTGTIAEAHTSFESFGWAPDASNVVVDPRHPTWTEVSQKSTGTYDSITQFRTMTLGRVRARVVQRSSSIDVWDMDALSLFADPIVWSFSNDGGGNFWPAYDVRNNPNGVLTFPEGLQVAAVDNTDPTAPVANPGQSLMWRVVSYWPHRGVSSLTIRPWYGGLLSGITHRVGLATGGPNTMPYDHYPPIEGDARFQTWFRPIPQDWYWNFKVLARTIDDVVPTSRVLLALDDLMSFYKSELPDAPDDVIPPQYPES